jgi:alkylation response protein AidB-like acyl-CoA dehydrogenase
MTDTHGSKDLADFRREVRDWISANRPAEPDFVLPQSFLEVATEQQFEYLRDWQRKVFDAGYIGFDVPVEYGGHGIDPSRQAIVTQELGRARTPFLVNVIGLQWAGPTILVHGTEQQKKRLIKPILSGEEIWCQGFSEPAFGSDLASLQTRATKADDGYKVTGHKVWTTMAQVAKWMILLARTDPDVHKYAGISYFLFPMDTSGVTIEPLTKITREGGFNQVIFDEAPMPSEALLGQEGEGWKIAMTTLSFERGAAESSNHDRATEDLESLRKLVKLARTAQRDGKPAIDDPLIRDELTSLWVEAEGMVHAARRASVPGLNVARPMALPMMHKLRFSEFNQKLGRLACEILGTEAMLWMGDANAPDDAEWPRAFLNSYGFTIGGGTSEVQRNILGERVLGLPKSK